MALFRDLYVLWLPFPALCSAPGIAYTLILRLLPAMWMYGNLLMHVAAGTGLREAVSLLESMLGDGTDFVRQGASIALALVLVQQPEAVVEPFRKRVSALQQSKQGRRALGAFRLLARGCYGSRQWCCPHHKDRRLQSIYAVNVELHLAVHGGHASHDQTQVRVCV